MTLVSARREDDDGDDDDGDDDIGDDDDGDVNVFPRRGPSKKLGTLHPLRGEMIVVVVVDVFVVGGMMTLLTKVAESSCKDASADDMKR